MLSRTTVQMMTILPVLVLALAQGALCKELYVSPSGRDSNPGTKAKPFRTIAHARDNVAKVNGKMTGDIIVYLRGGTYEISSSVVFDSDDSGVNGHRVVYKAYPGETPIVSGGKVINGWSVHDIENNIYKASVGDLEFRQIYVNGLRSVRARHPNRTNEETLEGYFRKAGVTQKKPHQLRFDPSELATWDKLENLNEIEVVMATHWKQKRARIAAITGDTISFQSPENMARAMHHHEISGCPHFYENAYEFLDAGGEFYLNTQEDTLYYKPVDGEDMATTEVIVPTVETLLDVKGSSPSNRVHDLRFEGITFQYSKWTKPNAKGYQVMQGATWLDTDGRSPIPGAVHLQNASKIEVRSCTVRRTGAHGIIALRDVVSDCSFVGNLVQDTAGGGIYLLLNHKDSTGNSITDNTVERIGMYYADACGILVACTPDVTILHNEVRNVRYTGISTGWTWGDQDTAARNHDVGYNLIHRAMRLYGDGAGIYTLGKVPGMKIHNNYLFDLTRSGLGSHPPAGIYLDNGSCLKTVEANVMENVGKAFSAQNQPNHDNAFLDNYFNSPLGDIRGTRFTQKHIPVKDSSWPAAARTIMEEAGPRGRFRRSDSYIWHGNPARTAGRIGSAISCDGARMFVEKPHSPELDPEQLTVEAWIRMEEFQGGRDKRNWIVNKNGNELTDGHYALVTSGDRAAAYLNIGGGKSMYTVGSPAGVLKLNHWHHLAMTYDGQTLKLFVDGEEAAAKAINKTRTPGSGGLSVGRRQDGFTYYKGLIDDVRIYDRTLDAAELKGHYDKPTPIRASTDEEGLVGYWPF